MAHRVWVEVDGEVMLPEAAEARTPDVSQQWQVRDSTGNVVSRHSSRPKAEADCLRLNSPWALGT